MKAIKIRSSEVCIYQSIKEMPIRKYNHMQSLLLQDSGIGSTLADIDRHFKTLDAMLQVNNLEAANTERQNLQLAFYSCLEKINYKSLAFVCCIESIDGKEVNEPSDEGLLKVVNKLNSLTYGEVDEILEDVKKNCISN